MASVETTNQINSVGNTRPTGRIVVGLVLLLPAILCCVTELLIPTTRTFWLSLQKVDLLREGGEFVGLRNYTFLFSDAGFGQTLSFTILSLVTRLMVVAVVPLLLAWAVGQLGRPVRLGLRVVLTLPVVLFVPITIAITWVMVLHPVAGLLSTDSFSLADPNSARAALLFIDALYTFGLACGLGLIFYLPIWRRPNDAPPPTFKETLKPLLVTWCIGILATIVLTLNTFTLNFAMTAGGPGYRTRTLGLWLYQLAFRSLNFGPAASLASIILLVTLVLGVVAGLPVILTRLRLTTVNTLQSPEQVDNQPGPQRSKVLPSIVLALTLLLTLGVCSLSVLPFGWLVPQSFGEGGFAQLLKQISPSRILVNTFIPPFVAAVVQLLVAYLAALSLGALQPLGKRSEWLLLAFSPWLFITLLPLSLVSFIAARESGTLNTFAGLIPPILFSVPILFILTIFFKGQAPHWQTASANNESSKANVFFKHLILPSLPLVGVLLLFLLLIGWQNVFWPLLVSSDREYHTLGVALLQLMGMYTTRSGLLAAAVTLFIVPISSFFFATLILFQILYLDRLVLYTDDL